MENYGPINKRKDQDGNMRFQAIVRLKGFPTQTATFTRLTDAKQWIQNTESAIREGRHFKTSEAKKHTLTSTIDRYIKLFNPPYYKKAQLEWWKKKFGHHVLCDITPAILATGRDELS
ncbi:MAG: site-specific integrase, partial [Verrucomicrobia bacterium]|nr:site-specific integrase [Verrucomicrobiota bacterium]